MPAKFRPEKSDSVFESWSLPDVAPVRSGAVTSNSIGQSGIEHKKQQAAHAAASRVTVVEDEIVAEKVTLAELEKIHEQAHLEGYEAGREEGRTAGHKEGYEKGLAEGLEKAQAEVIATQQQLSQLIAAMTAPLAHQHQRLSVLATELSLAVSAAIIPTAIAADFKAIEFAITESLKVLPEQAGQVRVWVNPEELEAVKGLLADVEGDPIVVGKADIQRGGCVVKSEHTDIDYQIETRLEAISAQLRERLALALSKAESPSEDMATHPTGDLDDGS